MEKMSSEEITCPKCLLEGVKSRLSEPEKTEEGWVQYCERGHKLYIWSHIRVEEGLMVDLLNKKAYSCSGVNRN